MASNRWSIALVGLPVGCLIIGAALHSFGLSIGKLSLPLAVAVAVLLVILIFATVFAVLYQAEALAERLGEPYGALLLTIAVTTIEVSVIVSMMLDGANNPTLARESVFSTVMIVTTGVVGACLFFGGLRHGKQDLRMPGTSAFLAVLIALTVLSLVLPNYTIAAGPGNFSTMQLGFVSVLSALLYAAFLYAQTVRHHEDFVEEPYEHTASHEHAPDGLSPVARLLLLIVGLGGIVLLTEEVATSIEKGLHSLQVEQSDAIIGAFIATLVLMPESAAAIRAALNNRLQRSLNVALGSACATIGLTIPAVAAASLITGRELTLGLTAGDTVLLVLALAVSVVSFGTGRTTVLTGMVHLVIFVAYLLLIVTP